MNKPKTLSQWGKETASEHYGAPPTDGLETSPQANDCQKPQDIQDKQEKGYSNDSDGFVRGKVLHPYFDHQKTGK